LFTALPKNIGESSPASKRARSKSSPPPEQLVRGAG
jgi:hypothetical protein